MNIVEQQLHNAKILELIDNYTCIGDKLFGQTFFALIPHLESRKDEFIKGRLTWFHRKEVKNAIEFRSIGGKFGKGSVQIVINSKGELYADVDKNSPYDDVVSFIGHTGEVIGGLFRRKDNV